MHSTSYLLALASIVPLILADRGTLTGSPTTICNEEPTQSPFVYSPLPTCYHAADPSGAEGYCPNLSDEGWCDCGADGIYPVLPSTTVCSYTTLPSTTLALTSTSCVSAAKRDVPAPTEPTSEPYVSIPERRRAERLAKRAGTITYSNCGDAPPTAWVNAGFATKEAVLRQAYADAVALATAAQNVAADNVGFTHYFGGTAADVQLTHFKAMMSAVASSTNYYSVTFECKNTPDCSAGGKAANSAMATDPSPANAGQSRVIQVCDRFFTATSTKYLLPADKTSPSPPYRELDNWCQKSSKPQVDASGRPAQWYATAGHTVLHELTHLDALAKQAGLEGDSNNEHGTLDVQVDKKISGDTCELNGARTYLARYKAAAGNADFTSPDYNAESYAAAATEIYFMAKCSFSVVK